MIHVGLDGLQQFFELIQDLTPGTRFQRTKDASDKVSVNTSDGDIPIDLISQGMSSVVAWVGELLHQLTIPRQVDHHEGDCRGIVRGRRGRPRLNRKLAAFEYQ